jgi:VanZ family protein
MNRFRHWLPALLWAIIIFYFSAQSAAPQVSKQEGTQLALQKLGHATEYAILAFLVHRALRRGHQFTPRNAALLAALIAGAYGISDEFHQLFVPGRYCMVSDMAIDAAGGVLAMIALYAYESRNTNR